MTLPSFWAAAISSGVMAVAGGAAAESGDANTVVAATAPARLRGTAFGIFNLASGVAMLIASALAGLLWDTVGPAATYGAGAVFSAAALVLLATFPKRA